MKRNRLSLVLIALMALLVLTPLACSSLDLFGNQSAGWTPVPVVGGGEVTSTAQVVEPTLTASPTRVPPTATRIPPTATAVLPTSTPRATATAVAQATIASTAAPAGPRTFIVTDADIASMIASGAGAQEGLEAEGLEVRFTGGAIRMSATRLRYQIIQVQNLVVVARPVAVDGVLQVETEQISPQGLITAMIPSLMNQALRQYGASWYVESVEVREGEMELTVR